MELMYQSKIAVRLTITNLLGLVEIMHYFTKVRNSGAIMNLGHVFDNALEPGLFIRQDF